MFITLLTLTFLIALAVSFIVVIFFSKPLRNVLQRIIADEISVVWLKYLKFAIFVVGISSGVRIYQLERYIAEPKTGEAQILELTADRWVLEIYRTIIETLQGIAWMLLVFFIFALIAYVIVRVFELKGKSK